MKEQVFEKIKEEVKQLLFVVLILVFALKVAFYKDNFMDILRVTFSSLWLFLVPGYCIMLKYSKNLGFFERILIGPLIAAGIIGILSYYLGLIGLHLKFHMYIIPAALIIAGLLFANKKIKSQEIS